MVIVLCVSDPRSKADEAHGCVRPKYDPVPACGCDTNNPSTCVKWVEDPVQSQCTGTNCDFVCFTFTMQCTVSTYTFRGCTSSEDCPCDSNRWVADPNNPHHIDGPQSYNNDTQCGG